MSELPISEEDFESRMDRNLRIAEALVPQYLAALESAAVDVSARTRGKIAPPPLAANADVAAERAYWAAHAIDYRFCQAEAIERHEYENAKGRDTSEGG